MNKNVDEIVFNVSKLRDSIDRYRSCDLKKLTLNEVRALIFPFYSIYSNINFNIGSPLFRVRKIEDNEEHIYKKDVWCPDSEKITRMGRANDIGESIFYASLDPITAIREKNIVPGERFSLAIYDCKANEKYKLSTVCIKAPKVCPGNPSAYIQEYSQVLNEFMVSEFTKQVNEDEEYKYKGSCAIAKILLELPYKESLLYPSMRDSLKFNFVIQEKSAKRRLSLKQVLCCQFHEFTDSNKLKISQEKVAMLDDKSCKINYYNLANQPFEISHDMFFKDKDPNESILASLSKY